MMLARTLLIGLAAVVSPAPGGTGHANSATLSGPANAVMPRGMQRVKHVFVITLENEDYDETFGKNKQAPYLQTTLTAMGAQLRQYYGTAHASLGNYIAMISGQPATADTQRDCPIYKDFVQTGTTADGIPIGDGCIYPATVKTLPDQLKARNLTWKGYMEDMGNDPSRESATCGHPKIGAADATSTPLAPSAAVPSGDQYATRHNPFAYFHSIIDSPDCDTRVVPLSKLDADLASVETTANFVFITPQVCSDGHDGDGTGSPGKGCVDGKPGGLASADAFLKTWVPKILASPAYKQDGLLIINFDEGISSRGETCCDQQTGPNAKRWFFRGNGGDRTGAVLISPFIKPKTISDTPYNHYGLLKSMENIFQVDGYLGYARQRNVVAFGSDIFAN